MSISFADAQPTNSRAIISIAGPAGSGKTASALRLATGIVADTDGDIYYSDTENNRALKYSKEFKFKHYNFEPPFTAARYLEAIKAVDAIAKPGSVHIIDSTSHEHEGMGGAREQVEAFLDQRAKGDWKLREKLTMAAWILPKEARTKLITNGLQRSNCYIILLFRAKDKTKPIKNAQGKIEMVNLGIQVIGADEYAFESDVIFILPPGSKGKPDWNADASRINDMNGSLIKALQSIPQINEEMGRTIRRFYSVPEAAPVVDKAAIVKRLEEAAKKGNAGIRAEYTKLTKDEQLLVKDDIGRLQKLAADSEPKPATETSNDTPAQ